MSYTSIVDSKTMEKLLFHLGFVCISQKGSHVLYRHPDGRYITVPLHTRDLPKTLIRKILREISISAEEFKKIIESL